MQTPSLFSNNAGFFPRVSICDKVGWHCAQYRSYAVMVGVTSHACRPGPRWRAGTGSTRWTVYGMTQQGRLEAGDLVLEHCALFKCFCSACQVKRCCVSHTRLTQPRHGVWTRRWSDLRPQTRLLHVLAGPSMTIRSSDAQARASTVLTLYASETQTRQLLSQWLADGSIAAR